MFDIFPNSPHGFQRNVAAKYHKDYANVLYLDGRVDMGCGVRNMGASRAAPYLGSSFQTGQP